MTKKPLTSVIVAVGVVSMALAGSASARSVSALTGSARLGTEVGCFNASFNVGTVAHSGCPRAADFEVPLTTDTAGSKALTFTSRGTAAGGSCRAVTADRFGTTVSASPFLQIPVSATYVSQTTVHVSVPGLGIFFADCIMVPGDSLAEFDYSP